MTSKASTRSCSKPISLPVLNGEGNGDARANTIAKTSIGKWRAIVLIAVHVFIVIHMIQWLIAGMTLSPVEPSESMEFLKDGVLNAGAIMFAIALLSTALFGRFFCGWLCHVVALQDFCAWLLGKVGIRPRAFRSRLLMLVPLGLAIYMFLWPPFLRLVLAPVLTWLDQPWPVVLGQPQPIERFRNELIVEDFWATFPEWYIAIPFLFVCGFAIVYFMGQKAFCTYGCPYGGFFTPIDRIAPVRVRVNDNCEQCGHCTASCTSNVRVHEEVNTYGMVVDPGCMKCGDCISVCPNDALSFGFGAPAIGAKPKAGTESKPVDLKRKAKRAPSDLSWAEEIAFAGVFLVTFIAYRGMLNQVPMLMAAGMAAIATYLCWKLYKVVRVANVRLTPLQLKRRGALTPWGYAFLLAMAGLLTVTAWSGYARYQRETAHNAYVRLAVPAQVALQPIYSPSSRTQQLAQRVIDRYALGDAFDRGGRGWSLTPDERVEVAYAATLVGDWELAESQLKLVIEEGSPLDGLISQLLQIMQRLERPPEDAFAMMRDAVERHPELHAIRGQLAGLELNSGRTEDAEALWTEAPTDVIQEHGFRMAHARFLAQTGRLEAARSIADLALREHMADDDYDTVAVLIEAATLAGQLGNRSGAQEAAVVARDRAAGSVVDSLAAVRYSMQLGQTAEAEAKLASITDRLLERPPPTQFEAAELWVALGNAENSKLWITRALDQQVPTIWSRINGSRRALQLAVALNDQDLVDRCLADLQAAADASPDTPAVWLELAQAQFMTRMTDAGVESFTTAAQLSSQNANIAEQLATILLNIGRADDAILWRSEAESRRTLP
jgi:polyferredoxin/tetratricopeptide (TPR) repeat protein